MENFFKYILFPILVVSLGYFIWRTFFGEPTQLELSNKQLKDKIELLESKKDSILKIKGKLKLEYDSLLKINNKYDSLVKKDKEMILFRERQLRKSLDSLNKYKNQMILTKKKIEELKKRMRVPSNQETLDFFKKY